ncbi:MAG: OmpH family outer membrane protein [Candidatus Omnitrophica bacterium]|nr:OmpH family outer membrane protein [Candidatus Omnitrophota bacterium]
MRKMKIMSLVLVIVFAFSTMAFAQEGVKKIGYLDLSLIFDSYEKTKEFDSLLEGKHKEYEKLRTGKIDKIKEVQGRMALLKEEEKGGVEGELESLKEDLMTFDQAQRADLTKQRDERIREILLEIEKIVSDFAVKEKYDLILNDRVLIYGSDVLNITESVLQLLNETYNKK